MESSLHCHPVKKIDTGTAQSERVHQDNQASQTTTLFYNNYKGKDQAKEPWHAAQPDC